MAALLHVLSPNSILPSLPSHYASIAAKKNRARISKILLPHVFFFYFRYCVSSKLRYQNVRNSTSACTRPA